MTKNILMEKAIEYATINAWYVFPTREKDSNPFIKKGKKIVVPAKAPYILGGFKMSSRDEKNIYDWWTRYPDAGIGIDCGKSGLVCVDIDVRKEKKGFDNYMSMKISDEGALHSITPSGGIHIVFKGSMRSHANVKAGVDIRSRGAYFVAPPSFICEGGKKLSYVATDDWNSIPANVPSSLEEEINKLRGKYGNVNKQGKRNNISESLDVTVRKAKRALDKLPQHFCDDYFEWVTVGLALKSLGDSGLALWHEWSKQSEKYDPDALDQRWETMQPEEITIASLFFWAKEAEKNGK